MIIGIVELKLSMPGNRSLKDKRTILKSLKDGIRNRFNVSVAEVGSHDEWCAASVAAAMVSVEREHAHQVLEAVAEYTRRRGDAVLLDYAIQML
ncbi:MAG: DUF503 domain-containing protein [Candidatus Aureabacteria bacterium]|nr:DUF503 domain-containing protein [Candidatus Auribacterota bacterium]